MKQNKNKELINLRTTKDGHKALYVGDISTGITAHSLLADSLLTQAERVKARYEDELHKKRVQAFPRVRPVKLTPKMRRNILLGLLGQNKEESAKFIECQYTLNILLRACGILYDEMVGLYDEMTDPAFKQAVKNAEKCMVRLLDACRDALHLEEDRVTFVNDRGRTKDDEAQWTFHECAEWLQERVRMLVTYGMVMNSDEWRLKEVDNVLERVMSAEHIDRCREAMHDSIRRLIDNEEGEQ